MKECQQQGPCHFGSWGKELLHANTCLCQRNRNRFLDFDGHDLSCPKSRNGKDLAVDTLTLRNCCTQTHACVSELPESPNHTDQLLPHPNPFGGQYNHLELSTVLRSARSTARLPRAQALHGQNPAPKPTLAQLALRPSQTDTQAPALSSKPASHLMPHV